MLHSVQQVDSIPLAWHCIPECSLRCEGILWGSEAGCHSEMLQKRVSHPKVAEKRRRLAKDVEPERGFEVSQADHLLATTSKCSNPFFFYIAQAPGMAPGMASAPSQPGAGVAEAQMRDANIACDVREFSMFGLSLRN